MLKFCPPVIFSKKGVPCMEQINYWEQGPVQSEMDITKTVHRKLREAQGELTQRAFARKLGISVGLIARLTNGPENMTLSTLAKISRALHVTPSQLLDDADTHHRKGR
jgi:predicted transcriptional regulator